MILRQDNINILNCRQTEAATAVVHQIIEYVN